MVSSAMREKNEREMVHNGSKINQSVKRSVEIDAHVNTAIAWKCEQKGDQNGAKWTYNTMNLTCINRNVVPNFMVIAPIEGLQGGD